MPTKIHTYLSESDESQSFQQCVNIVSTVSVPRGQKPKADVKEMNIPRCDREANKENIINWAEQGKTEIASNSDNAIEISRRINGRLKDQYEAKQHILQTREQKRQKRARSQKDHIQPTILSNIEASPFVPQDRKIRTNKREVSDQESMLSRNHLTSDSSLQNSIQEKRLANGSSLSDSTPTESCITFPKIAGRRHQHQMRASRSLLNSSTSWKFDLPPHIHSQSTNAPNHDDHLTTIERINKLIGKGGYAVNVYSLRHRLSKELYCVKQICKSKADRLLVQREISIHSRLLHPNIVRFVEAYETFDHAYIALEICHGDLSKTKLSNPYEREYDDEPPMSLNEASWYVHQVLLATSYLHRNNIFHRDIKPENILTCKPANTSGRERRSDRRSDGVGYHENEFLNVKLCDFGWSIHADNDKRENASWRQTFCGTVEYVPVEMLNYVPLSNQDYLLKRDADVKVSYDVRFVDSWSIGILAYELGIGMTPFYMSDLEQNDRYLLKGYCEHREVVFDTIREIGAHIEVDLEVYASLGTNSRDTLEAFCSFVQSMTMRKPGSRLTADKALLHDWIRSPRVDKGVNCNP